MPSAVWFEIHNMAFDLSRLSGTTLRRNSGLPGDVPAMRYEAPTLSLRPQWSIDQVWV